MSKYRYLIIDTQNVWWRNFIVSVKNVICDNQTELSSLAIKKALISIKKLQTDFGYIDSKLYLLFDNPENVLTIRKVIDENYKSHRLKKSVPKGIYEILSIFVEILKNYSDDYFIFKVPSLEADDLTYPLLKSLPIDKKNKAIVISNDLDWARNLKENIDWWNYNKLYTVESFKKEYSFDPSRGKAIQIYKAIHGDTSDNIENVVPYLPKEILFDIVNRFESIDDLFKNLWKKETNYPHDWKLKLKEAENNIRKNFTLVDFILLDIKTNDFIIQCKRKPKLLRIYFDSFNIPLEKDMFTKKDSDNSFFTKKNIKKSIY